MPFVLIDLGIWQMRANERRATTNAYYDDDGGYFSAFSGHSFFRPILLCSIAVVGGTCSRCLHCVDLWMLKYNRIEHREAVKIGT